MDDSPDSPTSQSTSGRRRFRTSVLATTGLSYLSSVISSAHVRSFSNVDESFFVDSEIEAYRFIDSHYSEYGRFPSLDTCIENGHTLPETTPELPDYYLSRLSSRKTISAVTDNAEALREAVESRDGEQVLTQLRSILNEAQSSNILSSPESGTSVIEACEDQMRESLLNRGRLLGLPTGFDKLDEAINGIRPTDLMVVTARPGQGKSMNLTKMLEGILYNSLFSAVEDRKRCLFVSMEMPSTEIMQRLISLRTGINPRLVESGEMAYWSVDSYLESTAEMKRNTDMLFLSGESGQDTNAIKRAVHTFNPDIIFVDAAYLLNPISGNKYRDAKHEKVANVFRELRAIPLKYRIPVVATVQLNRQAEGRSKKSGVRSDHVAGTDEIIQLATVLIALHKLDTVQEGQSEKSIHRGQVVKSRGGGEIDFYYEFHSKPRMDIVEIDRPTGFGLDDEDEEDRDY